MVALKKIFEAFHNATDAQRTFREIMFLQQLAGHDNIVRLMNVLKADNDRDIYLVFDFMGEDSRHNRANPLQGTHNTLYAYPTAKQTKWSLNTVALLSFSLFQHSWWARW